MAVFDRSELQASPLADLHAIADQLGLDGFRRLRKADLIDAILGEPSTAASADTASDGSAADTPADDGDAPTEGARRRSSTRGRRSRRSKTKDTDELADAEDHPAKDDPAEERPAKDRSRAGGRTAKAPGSSDDDRADGEGRVAEGVVELLGNGSAFLRINPPDASDEDVYISAAQVRRCELVSGDRVTGPLRRPRRSERYPSLVQVQTINGASAGEVSEGARYDDRPVAYPSERLALDGGDATLQAIEWLTPFGRGSRAVIAGPARSGKTEILRRLLGALADRSEIGGSPSGREDLEVTLVLTGVRPEEIAEWSEGSVVPASTLSFAASADAQGQAVERAIETAKRTAARGGDALVLIDTLDGLPPQAARRVLAAARKLSDGGSLTILATATRPFGGETTVIALDPALTGVGGLPLDLAASWTLRAELLVGEEGAAAIAKARASALAAAG